MKNIVFLGFFIILLFQPFNGKSEYRITSEYVDGRNNIEQHDDTSLLSMPVDLVVIPSISLDTSFVGITDSTTLVAENDGVLVRITSSDNKEVLNVEAIKKQQVIYTLNRISTSTVIFCVITYVIGIIVGWLLKKIEV